MLKIFQDVEFLFIVTSIIAKRRLFCDLLDIFKDCGIIQFKRQYRGIIK